MDADEKKNAFFFMFWFLTPSNSQKLTALGSVKDFGITMLNVTSLKQQKKGPNIFHALAL